jgi:tetratricopeptide (TPR) repeat protein
VTLHDLQRFGGPHHQALEVLCVKALERGDIEAAYRLSDRRCRIRPLAEAHCFVLRSEALYRMGERVAALADLDTALQIAPDDLAANRRMLAWGEAEQQIASARTLISHERNPRIRKQAATILRASGEMVDEKSSISILNLNPLPKIRTPVVWRCRRYRHRN